MPLKWNLVKKNLALELAFTIAAAATIGYFINTFSDLSASRGRFTYNQLEALRARDLFKNLESKIDQRNERTEALLTQLSKLTASPPPNSSRLAAQLALAKNDIDELRTQVADLHSAIDKLNTIIESSPEKALAVPLLTKDLNDFKTTSQHDTDSLRGEMLRAYELNKWLIGLMLAALLALVLKAAFEPKTTVPNRGQGFE
jgi:tetrahydromethanopterin S-methyltransferase subunit B